MLIDKDNADKLTQIQVAAGTTDVATERTITYSNNDLVTRLVDAENNATAYVYDGQDRLWKTYFSNSNKGVNDTNGSDYEQLTYENTASNTLTSGTVASRQLRDGTSIGSTYDSLGRLTVKTLPNGEPAVSYSYDNLNRLTAASQPGNSLSYTYDALNRTLTETGPQGTVTSGYDLAGRRTQITYPGSGLYVNYDYLLTGEVSAIRENGAVSGVGVLASYAFDDLGRRTSLTFGNGTNQTFAYDAVSRLSQLTNNLSDTSKNLTATFGYRPSGQIASATRTGNIYAFTGATSVNQSYVSNGLNQYSTPNLTYDPRGNTISDGTHDYCYSSENLLTSSGGTCAAPTTTLAYDPAMRLYQIGSADPTASKTRFAYDASNMLAEYNGSNTLQRRYVFGPGGQPIVWYEGSGTNDRRFLSSDERGSVISLTDSSGTYLGANSYDEYGLPHFGVANQRFGYTGQAWLSELGLQYSRARIYAPSFGRFLQTDPIGYADGLNWYAYTHNDPVNSVDPFGLDGEDKAIVVQACRYGGSPGHCNPPPEPNFFGGNIVSDTFGVPGVPGIVNPEPIIVTATRRRSKQPTGPATPNVPSQQCRAATGIQADLERDLTILGNLSDGMATIAAVGGQEEAALPLEAISWGLAGINSVSHLSRGDWHGAAATLATQTAGSLVGKANRIFKIGGKAQAKFNIKVSSTLGFGTSKILEVAYDC